MNRRRPLASWLRLAEILLLAIGCATLAWVVSMRVAASRDQANWARELETQISQSAPDVPLLETSGRAEAGRPRPPAVIDRSQVVGRLEVPRLGLSAMTREGTDSDTLDRAVGHVTGTALPGETGNSAFAGHRDTFFRRLEHIRTGDRIVVTTRTGRHHYVVRDTRVVSPKEVSVLAPTPEPTLTLVTCYPFRYLGSAPERFIVRAEIVREAASVAPR